MRRTRWILLLVTVTAALVVGPSTGSAWASDNGGVTDAGVRSAESGAATESVRAAEPDPPGCPKGYFCAYSGTNQTGTRLLRTWGNWSGRISGVQSVFNNGLPCGGCDHVQLNWEYLGNGWTRCIHYNPGPGQYKINFVGVTITRVVWRGECGPGEDTPRPL